MPARTQSGGLRYIRTPWVCIHNTAASRNRLERQLGTHLRHRLPVAVQCPMTGPADTDRVVGPVRAPLAFANQMVQLQQDTACAADTARIAVAAVDAGVQPALGAQPPARPPPDWAQQAMPVVQQTMKGQAGSRQAERRQQRRRSQAGQDQGPAVQDVLARLSLPAAIVTPDGCRRRRPVLVDVGRQVVEINQQAGGPGNDDSATQQGIGSDSRGRGKD